MAATLPFAFDEVRQQAPTDGGVFLPDEEPLVRRVYRCLNESEPTVRTWQEQAQECHRNYDGHQWDEQDIRRMDVGPWKRPHLTYNELKRQINAISGLERLNRTEARFETRALDSTTEWDEAGDLATESLVACLEACHGHEERSDAIKDSLISGMGWCEIRTDYLFSQDPNGRVVLEKLDDNEMYWAPNSRKVNLEDSTWRARKRKMPLEDFSARWPEMVDKINNLTLDGSPAPPEKYHIITPFYSWANQAANPPVGQEPSSRNRVVEVIQYQWRELVPVYRILDEQNPDGQLLTLREREWNSLTRKFKLMGQAAPMTVKQQLPVYKQVYVANRIQLEEPNELPGGFSLLCITGLWDADKKIWYGIMRDLLDPQRTMNKALSSALNFLLSNAKGGVMWEANAFKDPDDAKRQWARNDAWIELNEGGAQKIIPRTSQPVPESLPMFFQVGRESITRISGINDEMIGLAQGEVASPAQQQRIQGGLAVLGWLFDNISRFRETEARTMLEFIREYWTLGQLIDVGGDFAQVAMPLLRSNLPMDYRLVLDQSIRHNPNLKAQIWQDVQQLIPSLLKAGLSRFVLRLLKFSPLPRQLYDELVKEAMSMTSDPSQPKGRGAVGAGKAPTDPNELAAKVEKLRAETEKLQAETQKIFADMGMDTGRLVLDGVSEVNDMGHQKELMQHRTAIDLIKAIRAKQEGLNHAQTEGNPDMASTTSEGAVASSSGRVS